MGKKRNVFFVSQTNTTMPVSVEFYFRGTKIRKKCLRKTFGKVVAVDGMSIYFLWSFEEDL